MKNTLAEVVALTLDEAGVEVLRDPKRFISFILDLADTQDRSIRVLTANCDTRFMQPFVEAVLIGSAEGIERAATRSEIILSEERFIQSEVAQDVCHSLASGIAHNLGVRLSSSFVNVVIPYDVFVCCRESEEVTGERTLDSRIAHKLYELLTNMGFRVFYPRVALESEPIERYDILIAEARDAAKAMLLVVTSERSARAPWLLDQFNRYAAAHGRERSLICLGGKWRGELPYAYNGSPTASLGDKQIKRQILDHIRSKEGGTPTTNHRSEPQGHKTGSGELRWTTKGDIEYDSRMLESESGKVMALTVRATNEVWPLCRIEIATPDSSRRIEYINDIAKGEERLFVAKPGERVVRVMSTSVQSSVPPVQSLTVEGSLFFGRRLNLLVSNRGSLAAAIETWRIVTMLEPKKTFLYESPMTIAPGEQKTVSIILNDWERNMLLQRSSVEVYANDRLLPRSR